MGVHKMTGRVENINTDILRQCREQMGLDQPAVKVATTKVSPFFI